MGGDRVPGPFDEAVDEETRRRRELHERHLEGDENMERIRETLELVKVHYAAEFFRLDEIAVDVYHGRRGGFLIKYADAWLHADAWNKRLMRPVWEAFIRKYGLEEDPTGTAVSEVRGDP